MDSSEEVNSVSVGLFWGETFTEFLNMILVFNEAQCVCLKIEVFEMNYVKKACNE